MSEIYLIRHGQASFGADNYDHLSELGREQARILGDYFRHLGMSFDHAYAGSLERQKDTAHIVLSRCCPDGNAPTLRIAPEFNEYDSYSIIGIQAAGMVREDPSMASEFETLYTDKRSFQKVLEIAMLRWIGGYLDEFDVETWDAFAGRVRDGIRLVVAESGRGKRVAVFCSGGTISAAVHMVLAVSPETALRLAWQIRNTSISVIKYNEERMNLYSFNATAHLDALKNPEFLTYG